MYRYFCNPYPSVLRTVQAWVHFLHASQNRLYTSKFQICKSKDKKINDKVIWLIFIVITISIQKSSYCSFQIVNSRTWKLYIKLHQLWLWAQEFVNLIWKWMNKYDKLAQRLDLGLKKKSKKCLNILEKITFVEDPLRGVSYIGLHLPKAWMIFEWSSKILYSRRWNF